MRSRSLNRRNDRHALMLTLAGAGASLVVMLLVLGEPALRACVSDDRGTIACLREAAVERLQLPVDSAAETPDVSAAEIAAPRMDTPEVTAPDVEAPALPIPATPTETTPPPAVVAETTIPPEPEPTTEPDPVVEPIVEPLVEPEPLVTAAIEPEAPRHPYRPEPGKLDRAPLATLSDNVATPAAPAALPAPLPAETGSIETPVAPAVESLVEPERIELPQLPPPPLVPERAQRPSTVQEPVVPIEIAPEPLSEPAQLADQPLPNSALPPPVLIAPTAAPTPADSAAAAATAIADPTQPPVPGPVSPPAFVAPPSIPMAEISPIPPEPAPDVAATPPAEPTIDTIAFDLTGTVVAGEGPRGAIIRLYVDAELAGEGQVLDGRWEVFDAPLFASPTQTLRAVAIDPETGRVLGETEISIELELPESAAPPMVDELVTQSPGPDRIASAAPMPETPALEAPGVGRDADLSAEATPVPAGSAPPAVIAPAEAPPKVLPPLRTVVPRGETSSVTILPDSRAKLVEHPGSGFAILED